MGDAPPNPVAAFFTLYVYALLRSLLNKRQWRLAA